MKILRELTIICIAAAMVVSVTASEPENATAAEPPILHGWVDMHTHPMAHLGFGGKLLHGAPDLGITMSAIPQGAGCDHYRAPVDRQEASREDRAIHGGFGLFDNTCGDLLRREFIRGLEGALGAQTEHQDDGAFGYPDYNEFPAWNDLTHQQMWVDWVRRTWEGGLRVMVALAVNNRTVAAAVMGSGDINGDDVASANIQIEQMVELVSRHPWMEIAYTPADLRRIVSAGNLAIVLGVEIDNPGNMQWNSSVSEDGDAASRAIIDAELRRLWDQGVRYIFPVHVVDNKFGGTAIYEDQFNMSNLHQRGEFWELRCESGISHRFEIAGFDLAYAIIKLKIGIDPFLEPPPPPECEGGEGHANTASLTPLGRHAIEEMMRLGMMIDIDHMSTLGVDETLSIADDNDYPINSGHNSPREEHPDDSNENQRTNAQYAAISSLGGMVGLGSGELAIRFVRTYQYVDDYVDPMQIAIGTDANGLVLLPQPDPSASVIYDPSFPPLTDGFQTWDMASDGVANYGLFADYVRHFPNVGMTAEEHDAFFSTAEGFARMWEQTDAASAAMVPTPPVADAGGPYTVDEGATIVLDASATSDINQPAESLTYEWDFDEDGLFDDASGIAPEYAAADGPSITTIALRVTDDDGMTDEATAMLTEVNVAPTGVIVQLEPMLIFQGMTASFEIVDVTDPSSVDVAAGFEYAIDCTSDGSLDEGWTSSSTLSCTYPTHGVFDVTGSVRDKDGGIGTSVISVTVLSPSEAMDAIAEMIEALRDGGSLNGGQANALLVKLAHARELYESGDSVAALRQLRVLAHQVDTYGRTGVLTAEESEDLAFWIEQLVASIVGEG